MRAIRRLSLLIGLPFVAGLVFGIVVEEPELLAGHLRGESEDVVLVETGEELANAGDPVAPGGGDPKPGSSAAAETAEVEPAVVQERAPRPAPAPSLPQVAAAPAPLAEGDRWAIQVGAFSEKTAASRLVEGLRGKGYPAELIPASGSSSRWRVRVQPIGGEAEARSVSSRLKRVEGLPTWVMPMEGRSVR